MEIRLFRSKKKDKLGLGREWDHYLAFGWWYGPFMSIKTYLVKHSKDFKKEQELVDTKIFAGEDTVGINFTNWKKKEHHTYYDGCNCIYYVGPLYFSRMMHWGCEKCRTGGWDG